MKLLKSHKRIISCIIAILLLLAAPAFAQEHKGYSDVPKGHWAHDAIQTMSENGIFKGTGHDPKTNEALFSPDEVMTRAQFVVALTRYLYPIEVEKLSNISGVNWYQPNYTVAVEKGLLKANEFDNGDLTKPCTRQEMSMLLVRASKAGLGETPFSLLPTSGIADYNEINDYYKEYVLHAYSMGMISGVDNKGTFAPLGILNRAQAATVIHRMIEPASRNIITQNKIVSVKWDDGIEYNGEYSNGEANGHGTMLFPKEGTYTGYFLDGLREGIGTFEWLVGDKYVGNWKNDMMHGYGVYKFSDGYEIKGIWEKNEIKATSLELDIPTTEVEIGKKINITALFEPLQITEDIEWTTSNKKVADITFDDNICTVEGKTAGTTKITAKVGKLTKSCEVTIKKSIVPITQIELNRGDYTMNIDETVTLTVKYSPTNATTKKVTWASSDSKIAKVNQNGRVEALKEGQVVISATTENGLLATCYINVQDNTDELWNGTWEAMESDDEGNEQYSWKFGYECKIDINKKTFEFDKYPFSYEDDLKLTKKNNYTYKCVFEDYSSDYEIYLTSISENMIIMEINEIGTKSYNEDEYETTYYVLTRED